MASLLHQTGAFANVSKHLLLKLRPGGLLPVLFIFLMLAVSVSHAQLPPGISNLVDAAKESGARVIIVEPEGEAAAAETAKPAGLTNALLRAREEFHQTIAAARAAPSEMAATLNSQGGGTGTGWVFTAVLLGIIYLLIGYGGERLFSNWARQRFMNLFNPQPKDRAEKIGYLIVRAVMMTIGVALMAVIALILAAAFAGENQAIWTTHRVMISWVFVVRAILVLIFNLTAPDAPTHRALHFSDSDARRIYRGSAVVFTIAGVIVGLCSWMQELGLNEHAHKLALLAGTATLALLLIVLALTNRKAIANAFLSGATPSELPMFGRLLATNWHAIFIIYVVTALIVSSVRLLLDQPNALGLVGWPLLIACGGIGVYGLGLVMIDRYFERNGVRAAEAEPEQPEGTTDPAEPEEQKKSSAAFQPLFEYGLALVVTIGCALTIAGLWGLQDSAIGARATVFFDVGLVIFIAYLAWKAVKVAIDLKIAEEEPAATDHDSDEIVGTGVSRIATLLPLFRSIILITIVVMAAMIILADLGVNIGPLIAGAGVIGLAIGFGAQTLVRDILSGAFFLLDDAFRRGEYIDIGSVKGSVERISIRSMQLRHHKGPLNTVPFGEIQTLTNYSRDWVIMKLPFRVTYDTDVEKVRKLIKKLGQELLQHPDIGSKFLDPLKSQGVYQMEDSAIIIRVKFKTKPGDQFEVRKHVYTRIRELFEQEGIEFAHREVKVKIADENDHHLTEKERQAVAGAVRPVIEEQPAGQKQPADGM